MKVSIVGSLRDREVACSASDRQGSNFESCVWRTVSSQSSHHPQEVLLAQFSLYVHKGGIKPDSFHFISFTTIRICEFVQRGDRLYTSESDVYIRQILTCKDVPRAEIFKACLFILPLHLRRICGHISANIYCQSCHKRYSFLKNEIHSFIHSFIC